MRDNLLTSLTIASIILALLLLAGAYLIPWQNVNWGKLQFMPSQTVTVTGEAKLQERTQIARFSAGINVIKDDKQSAINEANQKTQAIIDAVKKFGIPSEDIKTQNINVYQQEEPYYEEGRQKYRQGQWRINNTIEVTLRDVDKTGGLADILTQSGANSVYGPNFMLDDTKDAQNKLLGEAIKDARNKADTIAKSSERTLGKIINVTEGTQPNGPIFLPAREAGGGGGTPVEPGTETVYKTVTVTFELK